MLLLTGPPGSGKTQYILQTLRDAARKGAAGVQLLTPTSTMAEHLRNELAREGYLVRTGCVQTLFHFVESLATGPRPVSAPLLHRLVGKAVEAVSPDEFREVASYPGFRSALAGLMSELSLAGCGTEQLRQLHQDGSAGAGLAGAVQRVLARVEDELKRRDLALRGARLRSAIRTVEKSGVEGVSHLLFDGFFRFSELEIQLVLACARKVEVTLTLPEWEGAQQTTDRLLRAGFEEKRFETVRAEPRRVLLRPGNLDQEAQEIARRILREAAAGRPFREIGIVMRSATAYVPALRCALARFGIPARFYFADPLETVPVARRFAGVVEGILGGWDLTEHLLPFLMGPATRDLDRFEFAAREQAPGAGLELLSKAAAGGETAKIVAQLKPAAGWRNENLRVAEWAERLTGLLDIFPPPVAGDRIRREQVEILRRHAAASAAVRELLKQTAAEMAEEPAMPLSAFWEQVRAALKETSLRDRDRRRNVVHVMDAYEARQWELPVVFVCGLLEKSFPLHHSENPLLPDAARRRLASKGIHLRTRKEWEAEERFLFEIATTRATGTLWLSYPVYDSSGNENLPSFFLQDLIAREAPEEDRCRRVRPRPGHSAGPLRRRQQIRDEALRHDLGRIRSRLSPSSIEEFLRCPFRFFATKTLKLATPPPAPEDRLDALLQGTIAHHVLAEVVGNESSEKLEEAFERIFGELCGKARVPFGYRREQIRLELLSSLRGLLSDGKTRPEGKFHTEKSFEMDLPEEVTVRGRIDRIDEKPDGGLRVVDYKYSASEKARTIVAEHEADLRVQGGIYAEAVRVLMGQIPDEVEFCAFRRGVKWGGWTGEDKIEELIRRSISTVLKAAAEIGEGRIEPVPADENVCDYCDYRDICRVETAEPEVFAGGKSA